MTPEEFAQAMQKAISDSEKQKYGYDPECAHCEMDDIMCELLKKLGYSEGVRIFEDALKWYA